MILTHDQNVVLETLTREPVGKQFYWTGGTLLSHYYLHHRKSFDLDFFSDRPFTRDSLTPFIEHVTRALGIENLSESRIYDRWEFVSPTTPPLRFEFVHYNHEKKRLAPLGSYKGLAIDSLPDLAANKTMAYFDRNQPKDLFDVYPLLKKRKFTVGKLLSLVEQKFGSRFPEFLFWSESAKSLKRLESLGPYLLETNPIKQDAFLKDVKYFFLDRGKDFLTRQLG